MVDRVTKSYIKQVLILICFASTLIAQNLDSLVEHSLQFAEQQLTNTVAEVGDSTRSPYYTVEDGRWRTNRAPSWVSGWFPGCLWYLYERTSNNIWKQWAQSWTGALESTKYNTRTHDVGFIIFCSFGNGYRLTGNETYHDILIEAANSLSTRFDTTIGCVTVRESSEGLWLMIDTMPNLELLLWASQNGGEKEWYDMVVSHALKSSEDLIREDGSTYQDVYYDPMTGDIIRRGNHQGYVDSSTWARGHAWGLYGFTMVYRYTKGVRFLETAQQLADYFIDNLPDDYVPFWDFDAPDTLKHKDVSPSAISVSALLDLSTFVTETQAKEKYWNAALNILNSLCSPAYLAEGTISSGILLHGIQNFNQTKGIDVSLIYADYYFIEALLRYKEITTSVVAFEDPSPAIPVSIQLLQNYPNPFNPRTRISYSIPRPDFVTLIVYDVLGRQTHTLVDEFQDAGKYSVNFEASEFSSGLYFYKLQTETFIKVKKMLLLR